MSGGDLPDDLEAHRHGGDVGRTHRVAVHGRDVGRRLRPQRGDVGGQHAAVRLRQRRGFGASGLASASTRESASATDINATAYSFAR